MNIVSNKQKVLSFYKLIVGQRQVELIPDFVQEDYKQHNPMVKQGRAGLTDMISYLKILPLPPPAAESPIIRAIQEGDYVVTHLDIVFMGQRKVVIDLFKLNDGLLAEHWDVIQDLPDQRGLPVTATNGTKTINPAMAANISKNVVNGFYQSIINKEPGSEKFIKAGYIEHDPKVIGSGKSFDRYFADQPGLLINLERLIPEGDFVVAQLQHQYPDRAFSLFEIFRIADGQIVERWSASQQITNSTE